MILSRKSLAVFALGLFFVAANSAVAQGRLINVSAASTTTTTSAEQAEQSLFTTLSDIQNLRQQLLAFEIDLRQENEKTFPQTEDITGYSDQLKQLNEDLVAAENAEEPNTEEITALRTQIDETRFLLEQASQAYHESLELQRQTIERLNLDIEKTEAEIEKLTELAFGQALSLLIRFAIIIGLILLLLFIRYASGKMIRRLSGKIPVQRERALIRLNKIVFNILIAISILIALFSQVLSFLPFLAVLGTGLAFALRDIIASFIAWFVIGTDQGYKIGDLIEVGDVRGRVMEVHPILTILRETGMRGDTGKLVTLPNKAIFESNILNFSKMYRFTYIMVNFLLERDSNIADAKRELEEAVNDAMQRDIEEATKNLPNLQTKFGIRADDIQPKIFLEPSSQGLMLRTKFFCRLDNRHSSRTKITESFLERIRKYPDIKLRFVEFGDKKESE